MKKYSDETLIKTLEDSFGLVSVAARAIGCSKKHIYDRIKGSKKVAQALESIRESTIDIAESSLIDQIMERNTTATIFYLKTQGKSRGYVEKSELEINPSGNPIPLKILDLRSLSDEAIEEELLKLKSSEQS